MKKSSLFKSYIITISAFFSISISGCYLVDDSSLKDGDGKELGPPMFASGPVYGNYYPFAEGIIDAAGETLGIFMDNISTEGSLENATKAVTGSSYMGNAYMTLVQEDVFRYARDTNITQYNSVESIDKTLLKIASQLQVLLALYREDVHILVNEAFSIDDIPDLAGKIVNVGSENSGTYITAKTLLNANRIPIVIKTDDAATGIEKVLNGEYHAAFYVTAVPASILQSIPEDSSVKLIRAYMPDNYKIYDESGTILAKDYAFQDEDIGSNMTVKTLLAAGPNFDDRNIGIFIDYLFSNAGEYIEYNHKWEDVSLALSQQYMKANPQKCNYRAMCYVSGFPELDPFYLDPLFASGEGNSSYHDMAIELIWLLSHNMDLDLREMNTTGTLENAYHMLNGGATMALVQDDIFTHLTDNEDMYDSMMAASMKKVVPLHYEYLHLLVNVNNYLTLNAGWSQWYISASTWDGAYIRGYPQSITDIFTDPATLNPLEPDLYINLGPKTSGTFISAMKVINSYRSYDAVADGSGPDMEHMSMHYYFDSPSDAVLKVQDGEYHGAFVMSGTPYERFYSHDTWDISDLDNCSLIPVQFHDSDNDGDFTEEAPLPYSEAELIFEGAPQYEDYPYSDSLFYNSDGNNTFQKNSDSMNVVSVRAVQVVSPVIDNDQLNTYLKSVFRKSYYLTNPPDPSAWPDSYPFNNPINSDLTDDNNDGYVYSWSGFQPDQLWLPVNKESVTENLSAAVYHHMMGAKEYFVKNPFGWHREAVKYYLSMFEEE